MIQHSFFNIQVQYWNLSWLAVRAILITKNDWLKDITNSTESNISDISRANPSADLEEKKKHNDLKHLETTFSSISEITSLLDH